jgi:glucose/mannose-6-phosphate isomerase
VSRPPRLDSAGMWEAATSLPEQLAGALDTAHRAFGPPLRDSAAPGAIVGLGLGTAATACAAAAALAGPQLSVPFVVCRDAELPAIVGPRCLVLAVSCGPESPETLTATRQALDLGARVVGIGGDGELARLAAEGGFPWCPVAPEGLVARVALGGTTVSLLCALSHDGLLPDCTPSVAAAVGSLARRRDAFVADRGTAAELARRIGRTIPLVYGASGVGAVAARWWKSCVNLNAKSPAFSAELPALAYDELAGWGQGGDITRQIMTLVLLRHGGERAPVPGLFGAVRDATEEVMADVLEVWAEGEDGLGRFFDLALLGELVSLELAAREGVDPGPVPAVEQAHARQL